MKSQSSATNSTKLFSKKYYTLDDNLPNIQTNDEILFAIVTCNLVAIKRLVNSYNVNDIIDKKNKYTSLHHAVRIKKNDDIIEYLINCGASTTIKCEEGKDALDLSIQFNYRFLIDKLLNEKENKLIILNYKIDDLGKKNEILLNEKEKKLITLNYKINDLEKKNESLQKNNNLNINKINSLISENNNLKRKCSESDEAFNNLLKKIRKT